MAKRKSDKFDKKLVEQFGGMLVDKFDEDDLFDDCLVCQFEKAMQNKGRQPTLSELKQVFRDAKKEH